ncbi:hypothetical protein WG922_03290 [Ramlibacter sp. AN1015]|uniref:hypothetical protein n=1 Tax=Ramlibacter sp. AN1015 TaxID=3133428 RepID=UPI0030BE1A4E
MTFSSSGSLTGSSLRKAAACAVVALVAGGALAQANAPTPASAAGSSPSAPSASALGNAQALGQADARFREAREACLRHPEPARASCLEEARQGYNQATAGAAGNALPAVQTQSGAVSATGQAPVAVDQRVPAVPGVSTPPHASPQAPQGEAPSRY